MSKKLLVVEDSRPIARVIKQIGESLNYQVTIAASLAEVEALLQGGNNEFFAATIDYTLPDALNGEAISCVLSHGIPSVVLTGKMDEATRQQILSYPVIDYIPKENSQAFLYLKRILHWQLSNQGNGVLVVDDSLSARNHVVELLKRRNFNVYVAENGQLALDVLQQHNDIKMVITDLEMPVMDGIELTNEVRKIYSRDQLAIIGVSGATNGVHSARFIKNGADDFLRKPFCPEEFYCRITQNIENLSNIEQIQKAANTDYLTDLPNRRAFIRDAEIFISESINQQTPYALAILDIDYFKKVNDNYGHEAGDHILKVFALYMRKHFGTGLIARLGGEEFAIVIAGLDEDQLYNRLDDFRRSISVAQIAFEQQQINFSVSLGMIYNSHESLAKQMSLADGALYYAKENGRNQISIVGAKE
ncbi:response regulator [Colwellia sp. Arc7-635]|jgi:diguanylate cyclase (GGDEF)-like protein|uniref:diguanylate cyclase n=1 Tax=Colwellia sp. Arc7-635 TaxID=2497879 RepID=UPI000F84ECBC|nr:diguanylate cyclase [Colwellia sp. Arc7-635]AZQ86040.1 response regulator [Colwellia sp. Arc7-635]